MATDRHLAVLKRIDSATVEVLAHAGHVVLYEFEQDKQQWKRKGVEGPLFIYKRSCEPRVRIVVLNRLSTENLVQDLSADFQFEEMEPYLIYRAAEGKGKGDDGATKVINGIWFYQAEERTALAQKMRQVLKAMRRVADMTSQQRGAGASGSGAGASVRSAAKPREQAAAAASAAGSGGGGGGNSGVANGALVGSCTVPQLVSTMERAMDKRLAAALAKHEKVVIGVLGEMRKRQAAEVATLTATVARQQQQIEQLVGLLKQQQQ